MRNLLSFCMKRSRQRAFQLSEECVYFKNAITQIDPFDYVMKVAKCVGKHM